MLERCSSKCTAPMALCSRSNPSTEDWPAVGPKQAPSQTSIPPVQAPETHRATGQHCPVQSLHSRRWNNKTSWHQVGQGQAFPGAYREFAQVCKARLCTWDFVSS